MSFLAIIGFLALLGVASFLLISAEEKHEKEAQEYLKLIDDTLTIKEAFRHYRSSHQEWSIKKCVRKFFAEPERLEQAYQEKNERDEVLRKKEDERRKEFVLKRVYAYKYEDFLFSLFSPLAKKDRPEGNWYLLLGRLPAKYIKYRMQREGYDNVEGLFAEFVKQDLLFPIVFHSGMHENRDEYELGFTLCNYANVISDEDNNLDKWIKKHGQTMSKEMLWDDLSTYDLPF